MHCFIQPVSGMPSFFCTFIYAFNDSCNREVLWKDLKSLNTRDACILCGDFNCVMNTDERVGSPVRNAEIVDICECMDSCNMEDIKSVGNFYTWNNKQHGPARVFSKIDIIMANPKWLGVYSSAEVCFMNEGCFDHSPGLLTVYPRDTGGKKPFKYFTMWKAAPQFMTLIQEQWTGTVQGSKMFGVVDKVKKVKLALKELNKRGFSDIQASDLQAYHDMVAAQTAMHLDPADLSLADAELIAVQNYKVKHQAYLEFSKQKAKAAWLKDGDENTSLFHQSIKARNTHNQVYSICGMDGIWKDNPADISQAFLDYYTTLLAGEIKKALFSIPGRKAPGPDGYGSYFYKDAWSIVGADVISAVLDVLQHGKLLKELNHTVITLIPKTKCPKNVSEFRPISCCNTLYKCITKVICSRLRQVLPDLIIQNQGGFVHGRYMVHNIMVVQDLVKQYGRKSAKPSCMMKIDLQKAYDTVDWDFLQEMLVQLGFPRAFVTLVMECVTTPKFSLMLNGNMHAFELFSVSSGLLANKQKSAIYCCGMAEYDVSRIVNVSGFTRSHLPFKYLGVPICAKRISTAQCDALVDKMIARIKVWSSRNLSCTARMQLINSVLMSIHMYWAQVFILTKKVLHDVTKICRSFLWSGQAYSQKNSNISWDSSCCDKKQGGLGFRDVISSNIASIGKYVWAIASKQDNVWIKWVHAVYIKDGNWWDYMPAASASWYWKKISAIKEKLKVVYTQAELADMPHYSVKTVYEKIVGPKPVIHWDNMVWNRLNIPKNRFICWLAVQGRLQTTAKLARFGVSNTATCLICGQADEYHKHLFFACPYSSRMSKFKKQVSFAMLAAAVYSVWSSRNSSFWNASFPTVQNLVTRIKQNVRDRILFVMPKNVTRRDSLWFASLMSKFRKQVSFATLAAAVYSVWSSRNSSFWNASFPTVQNLVTMIKKNVRDRILFVMPKNEVMARIKQTANVGAWEAPWESHVPFSNLPHVSRRGANPSRRSNRGGARAAHHPRRHKSVARRPPVPREAFEDDSSSSSDSEVTRHPPPHGFWERGLGSFFI
ncbi:uncharacterized protein [Spinacia oleracea]|uniref:Reverse transcriptase domain-containing protein n=1 Tax=Spinacia oleracea TaxID=3562 RepID=A0ABM3RPW9_SPIOL|nr:uncharacterized protein LOC110789743 [Spinacia oleracea]